ncbi:MAG: CehA/McbA family metallohydrolase [Planctomycetaceae bacterium]|nr:CehA/McbA family metallohydrolase [Planctomycetaceae bacterium]
MEMQHYNHHTPSDQRSKENDDRFPQRFLRDSYSTRNLIATYAASLLVTLCFVNMVVADGMLKFQVDDGNGHPVPARVHIRDDAGKAVSSLGHKDHLDHLIIDGERTVTLPAGTYVYGVERSPEWERVSGEVTINNGAAETVAIVLQRLVDLSKSGWYSGDLHIHRPPDEIEDLMRASDLHIGPVITWWNNQNYWKDHPLPKQPLIQFDGNRFARLMSGEDEREGGALLYFGLDQPVDITGSSREFPSPMTFVEQARQQNADVHLDIEKPFWWDVPVWLAVAEPDTIGLANNHMCRDRMYETEAWGKPRDTDRLSPPLGNGFWTQEIYYHILNTGLRLPPSAGSASGVLPNPVGYNRVYVHVDGELTWEKWWNGLRAGRSFVTNGPIMLCRANGELPGHVFRADSSGMLRVSFNTSFIHAGDVTQFEIIHNGKHAITGPVSANVPHQFEYTFEDDGWFLIRVISNNPRTFRFASTAPFYIEEQRQPQRISRASCQFFLDWVNERIERVKNNITDPDERSSVLASHQAAKRFWQQRLEMANAP